MPNLTKVVGPPVGAVKRSEAIDALYDHPRFPKNARLHDIEEVDGKWVATLKLAEFPPGGIADDDSDDPELDSKKPPKKNKNDFEGPNGDNSDEPIDEGPDSDKSDDSDSSDSDKSDKGDSKGEKGEIADLKATVDAIANFLGIPVPGAEADSPIPGPDGLDSPDGPPGPPPPGAGAPPHGHGGPPGAGGSVPPRAMHPGDAPPGSTPVGAPAFASTKPENPFPEHIGRQKAFEISDITNKPLGECIREIKSMVEPHGYYIHQCKASHAEDGNRRVAALVADHPPKIK